MTTVTMTPTQIGARHDNLTQDILKAAEALRDAGNSGDQEAFDDAAIAVCEAVTRRDEFREAVLQGRKS